MHLVTLRMWLCMKWHGVWLYGVHRTRRDGSSFMWHQPCQRCKYTTLVDIQKRAIKSDSLMQNHMLAPWVCSRARKALYKSDQQQQETKCQKLLRNQLFANTPRLFEVDSMCRKWSYSLLTHTMQIHFVCFVLKYDGLLVFQFSLCTWVKAQLVSNNYNAF